MPEQGEKTMLNKMALTFAALGAVAMFGGCGGSDDTTTPPGLQDMAMAVFKVQSGTYAVSNIVKNSDSCMQNLTAANFQTLNVTNDGVGNLSLGDRHTPDGPVPQYDPAAYSQGTGMFTDLYHATTTMSVKVTADSSATCTYDLTRNNTITVTADNTLNMAYMQTQTNHLPDCTPVTTDCTSSYTFTLTKQ
jgi:hypothetical protein